MKEHSKKKHRTNPLPRHHCGRFTGSAKRWAFVLAVAVTGTASISVARANEAAGQELVEGHV